MYYRKKRHLRWENAPTAIRNTRLRGFLMFIISWIGIQMLYGLEKDLLGALVTDITG